MHPFGRTRTQAQRRGGAGPRRQGAARKPGTPTTPTGLGRQKKLSSAALKKARKMSTDGSKVTHNPFHSARFKQTNQNTGRAAMATSLGASAAANPFLAQLAASSNPTPFGEYFTNPRPPPTDPPLLMPPSLRTQPPSYAAVLQGKVPVPSFISHGPGSVPLAQATAPPVPQGPVNTGNPGPAHQLTLGPAHNQPSEEPVKTLHLKNVPEHLNNPPTLRKHFSQFGEISLLNCQPAKRYATVAFTTREAAIKAKRSARLLSDEHIQIFWHSKPQSRPRLHSGGTEQGLSQALPPYMPTTATSYHRVNEQGQQEQLALSTFPGNLKRPGDLSTMTAPGLGEEEKSVREGLNVAVVGGGGKRSVWERLGGREEEEEEGVKPAKGEAKGKARARVGEEDDKEWTPSQEGEGEGDEGEEEGVAEGVDSVLRERGGGVGCVATEEMDTIARSASHPYYLRSLHQLEPAASLHGPKSTLQVPRPPPEGESSSEMTKPLRVGVARNYGPPPIPLLPPPPTPQGQSAADLYQSLNTRDEEMRKSSVKQTSLTTAEVVVGMCPDMCPEKERYMREDRRRLSWFELNYQTSEPGAPRVDHQRAVKEYNRSAADKEEDLPHELRPEPILLMTMDYLVTCVMDEGEGRVEAWYDFLWNRTRAIRKDITLQHLCSEGCVDLTEKCVRFHVLCAYLLCQEEMTVFDQKMNHENLIKCLITLKQFYRDLRIEKNVLCENEAEFCCYDILLHLKDGSVLNIVEQYSSAIRQSSFVRQAVDIALAFSANNYTKFFKLVKSSSCSFLSACIVHRYFIEMRTTALRVMCKAYTLSKTTNFPLAKFTEILSFEIEAVATEFCLHFDLTVTKKMVKLSKEYTYHPPSSLPIELSPSLVGEKRVNRSLGEIVNGGLLPLPPTLPPPYDSFAPGTPLAPPTPKRPTYTDPELQVAIDVVLNEIINRELTPVAIEMIRNEQDTSVIQATICAFCEGVMSECVREECADIAMATLGSARRAWQIRETAVILEEVTKVVAMEMESGVIVEEVSEIVRQVLNEAEQELVAMANTVSDVIVCECVEGEVWEVSDEVMREAERDRQEKLENLEKQVLRKRQRKYWRRWRHGYKARRHARECLSAIPSLPPLLPLSAQLGTRRLLGDASIITRGSLDVTGGGVAELLEKERLELDEKRRREMAPLNVPSVLQNSLLITRPPSLPPLPPSHITPSHLYWSLAILHTTDPASRPEPRDLKLLGFLEQKLKFCPPGGSESGGGGERSPLPKRPATRKRGNKKNISNPGVREISISSTPLPDTGGRAQLKMIIKSVRLQQSSCCSSELRGVSSLVLLAPTPRPQQSPEDYKDDVIHKLTSVVKTEVGQIPMLVWAPFHVEEHFLAHWNVLRIALQDLPQNPAAYLSDVTFGTLRVESHTPQQDEEVCKGLKWLADYTPSQPPISCVSVRDYIEQGVHQYFLPLVTRDAEVRKKNGLASQPPHHLISLYNDVISHLANKAASQSLSLVSWPVHEFAPHHFSSPLTPNLFNNEGLPPLEWNGDLYLSSLRECILERRLVEFDVAPPTSEVISSGGAVGWSEECKRCIVYLKEHVAPSHQMLLPRVKSLLHGYTSHVTSNQSNSSFPWDHVIVTCIDHMISTAPADLWVTCLHGDGKEFTTPPSWLMAEAGTSLECVRLVNSDPCPPRPKRHRRHLSDSYLFDPHTLTTHTHTHHVTSSQLPLATKLAEKIDTEKQLSSDFEDQLKRLLSDGEMVCPRPLTPGVSDHAPSQRWAGSLEAGLKLLRMKIRTSKFQEKADFNTLKLLAADTSHFKTLL